MTFSFLSPNTLQENSTHRQRSSTCLYKTSLIIICLLSLVAKAFIIMSSEVVYFDGLEYFKFAQAFNESVNNQGLDSAFSIPVIGHWGAVLWGSLPFLINTSLLTDKQAFALFFALPSVISIALVYFISYRAFYSRKAGLIAAGLFALSFSNTYLVRHALPTDLSILFLLGAILLMFDQNKNKPMLQFTVGILCFMAFFTYYGYWASVTFVLLCNLLFHTSNIREALAKAFYSSAGFFAPLLTFLLIGFLVNKSYLGHFIEFSQTINEGAYSEGYKLPFAFFYHSEGLIAFIWLLCVSYACWQFISQKNKDLKSLFFLFAILFIYSALTITSNVTETFVVYGRIVKQLVPFLCILSAYYLANQKNSYLAAIFILCSIPYANKLSLLNDTIFYQELKPIEKSYQEKNLQQGREIFISDLCTDKTHCHDHSHCEILHTSTSPKQVAFFQYDEVSSPQERELIRSSYLSKAIVSCPSL